METTLKKRARGQEQKEERRRQILATAGALFRDQSFAETTMADVAARALPLPLMTAALLLGGCPPPEPAVSPDADRTPPPAPQATTAKPAPATTAASPFGISEGANGSIGEDFSFLDCWPDFGIKLRH